MFAQPMGALYPSCPQAVTFASVEKPAVYVRCMEIDRDPLADVPVEIGQSLERYRLPEAWS